MSPSRAARTELINLRDLAAVRARRPVLVAHRGGVIAPDAPENSLAAIRLAAAHGYDLVELDVARPRDDEPVIFHDWTGSLLKNCGVAARLADHTAQELTAIHYRATTEPIATLAQALALCRQLHLGVMLDIKVGADSDLPPGFLRRIAALLKEYALTAAAVTISDHPLVRAALAGHALLPVTAADLHASAATSQSRSRANSGSASRTTCPIA
jgi:glycerophosphoryl diester phosphodiesterase